MIAGEVVEKSNKAKQSDSDNGNCNNNSSTIGNNGNIMNTAIQDNIQVIGAVLCTASARYRHLHRDL